MLYSSKWYKGCIIPERMELKYKSISNSFLLELSLNIKERLMCQKKRALQYCVIFFLNLESFFFLNKMSCGKAAVVSYSYFTSTLIISWEKIITTQKFHCAIEKIQSLKAIYFENQYKMAKNKYLLQFKVIELLLQSSKNQEVSFY